MHRSAIVTGAGRGIGRALALDLAELGYDVAIQARGAEELEAVAGEIRARGRAVRVVPGDVTQAESASALVAAGRELGVLHVAVGAAGQAISAPVLKTTEAQVRAMLDVNFVSAFHLLRAAAGSMVAAQVPGRIVIVGSTASIKGGRYTGAYSASKHAVLGLVRSAALELAPKGITVNALCPGWVDTPMFEQTIANITAKTGRSLQESRESIEGTIPTGHVLTVQEVAAALRFLVSPGTENYTGQALVLDGGTSL